MSKEYNKTDFVLGAMIGGTLAAFSAMMFTTKKGRSVRRQIMNRYNELGDGMKDYANSASDEVRRLIQDAERKIKRKSNQLMELAGRKKKTVKRKVKKAKTVAKKARKVAKRSKTITKAKAKRVRKTANQLKREIERELRKELNP